MPRQLVSDYLANNDSSPPGEAEPALLVAEANHRIANNLSLIAGILRLQANEIVKLEQPMAPDEVAGLLSEVGSRVEAVGRLHRLLADDEAGGLLDLREYLHGVASTAIRSMSGRQVLLDPPGGRPYRVPAKVAMSVGLIVGEAVTNAVKYAHPTGVRGHIAVACERALDGSTVVGVLDDGVGLPEGFDASAEGGLGLRMMRIIAAQLGGELSFDSEPMGLTVRLRLPPDRAQVSPAGMI